jgi:hypothetical protein
LGLKFDSGLKPIPALVQPDTLQQINERHNPRNNLAIKFSVLSLSLLEHGARAIASHLEVFSHMGDYSLLPVPAHFMQHRRRRRRLEEYFGQTYVGDTGNGAFSVFFTKFLSNLIPDDRARNGA